MGEASPAFTKFNNGYPSRGIKETCVCTCVSMEEDSRSCEDGQGFFFPLKVPVSLPGKFKDCTGL